MEMPKVKTPSCELDADAEAWLSRLWQIEVLTPVDHLLRNEGKVLDHDGVNAGDVCG